MALANDPEEITGADSEVRRRIHIAQSLALDTDHEAAMLFSEA
jgi:hypothetical protein